MCRADEDNKYLRVAVEVCMFVVCLWCVCAVCMWCVSDACVEQMTPPNTFVLLWIRVCVCGVCVCV